MNFWQTVGWYSCGLAVALFLGHFATGSFLSRLRLMSRVQTHPTESGIPAWVTGATERLLFTLLVAFDVDGIAPAMMAWLALKLASNWNRPGREDGSSGAFSALLAGALSMLFALAGGLIIRRGVV